MANNLFANVPASCVAKQTITFDEIGITELNTAIIYQTGNPLKSYIPGRTINAITGFSEGQGYYIIARQDMDLSSVLIPPVTAVNAILWEEGNTPVVNE